MSKIVFIRSGRIYSESRSTKEILALAEAGHHVNVIGWDADGEAGEKCAAVFERYAGRVSFAFFFQDPEERAGNILDIYAWFDFAEKTLEKYIQDSDWVHACDLTAGWPAYQVCEKHGKKLVYDIYDYYIDSHPLPAKLIDVVEKMEIRVIDFADTTIICTEERIEQIQKAKPNKIAVIHNSPDVTGIAPDAPEQWDYAYCGTFPENRLIGEILAGYRDNQDLRFVFAGWGKYQDLAKECGDAANFTFKGRLPYAEILETEARAAALSAIYSPTKRNHRLCAPNKFYEALALGKPVIVCRGTGIDRIVENNEIGAVIDYDANEFYRALRRLLSDKEKRIEMGVRAKSLYETKYNWSIMKEQLLGIYGGNP